MRDARHEPERETAEHEQDRVGDSQERREREEPRARTEDGQQDDRVVRGEVHAPDAKPERR